MLLVLVHVVTPALKLLRGDPRGVRLSVAGWVSVAYVFVHLLPELAAGERALAIAGVNLDERDVFVIALAGLLAFYGLDRMAKV